jgi:beta-glucosidase-like glycosyl hydrolase
VRAVGSVIGRELRAFDNMGRDQGHVGLTSWAPTVNIIRDPCAPRSNRDPPCTRAS